MSKEQHTHGPWFVGAQNDGMYIVSGEPPSPSNDYMVHDSDRTLIAKLEGETFEMDRANARLIAAAPKLLEMLELTESNLSRLIDAQHHDKALMTPWRDCVRAAIAEAKGE